MRALSEWLTVDTIEAHALRTSPVHTLDARATLVTTLLFVAFTLTLPPHAIAPLAAFAAYPMYLIAAGGVPWRVVVEKVAMAAPFVLSVAALSPLLDRTAAGDAFGVPITAGWLNCFSILFRLMLTVSVTVALIACTGIHRLTSALLQLRVPRALAVQILLVYRYLDLMTRELSAMVRSLAVRSGGAGSSRLSDYCAITGQLLLRSAERARRVHQAMCTRGFDQALMCGTPERPWRLREYLFVCAWLSFFVLVRVTNPAVMLGAAITGQVK